MRKIRSLERAVNNGVAFSHIRPNPRFTLSGMAMASGVQPKEMEIWEQISGT